MRWAAPAELGCGDGSCDDTIGNFQFFASASTDGTVALGGGVSVTPAAAAPAPAPVSTRLYGGFTASQIATATNASFVGGNVTFRLSSGLGTTVSYSILPVSLISRLRVLPPMPAAAMPATVRSQLSRSFSLGVPAPPTSMSLTPFAAPTDAAAVPVPTAAPAPVKTTALVVGGGAALALLAWALL